MGFPTVSIVVTNYNYGQFLDEAIESALAQSYETEVVVVDDGSTDDSRSIIDRYARHVRAIYKENGGQGSAYNAGFSESHGDIVLFLDADDVLLPNTARQLAQVFRSDPSLVKVQYRLEVIDGDGRPTGALTPPANVVMPDGDLRDAALRHPDDIPYPPGSGNAFAASALRRIVPVPEGSYRVLADVYLVNLTALLGRIRSLDSVGGRYRVHGRNRHHASTVRVDRVRQTLRATHHTHAHLKALADSLGLTGDDGGPEFCSVTFVAQRLIALKLDPDRHPFRGDRVLKLVGWGIRASRRRSDLPRLFRSLYALWFLAAGAAPKPAARWLLELFLFPERRGRRFNEFLGFVRSDR